MSHLHRTRRRRSPLAKLAAAALIVSLAAFGAFTAQADEAYERGPDPTEESIRAKEGPFEYDKITVSNQEADGFGSGTIWYPTDTSEGTFGGVAVSPGYTAGENTIDWLGPRLASQGFVVITIETNTRTDGAESRGEQLAAALDYLTVTSEVKDRVDPERLGVMGHSAGAAGALKAVETDPSLQAVIPLNGYSFESDYSVMTTPALLIGGEEDDSVRVVYDELPADAAKAYLELNDAGHLAPVTDNETIGAYSVAWLKLFIDNDTRYEQFLCPGPEVGDEVSEYMNTCPYTS